mgnify:FL=1
MRIEKDYEDLLRLLNYHKVKYCIVGAYAVAFHKRPRYTKNIDILIEPSIENAKRIIKVLIDFGFENLKLTEEDFTKNGNIIQLGYEPIRVDILTSITGVSFLDVWEDKSTGKYGKEDVFFMGKRELIKNKHQTGRKQDLLDLDLMDE